MAAKFRPGQRVRLKGSDTRPVPDLYKDIIPPDEFPRIFEGTIIMMGDKDWKPGEKARQYWIVRFDKQQRDQLIDEDDLEPI